MLKTFLLLLVPFSVYSQLNNNPNNISSEAEITQEETTFHQYVSLNDNKIYDVEIIVFAYKQALPNYKTYNNKELFDDSNALQLQLKPEELNFIQSKQDVTDNQTSIATDQSDSEFTVSISDDKEDQQVLTWFLHDIEDYKLTSIWARLAKQENIVPLIHQSWRQNESPFDNPTYVQLNNLPEQTDEKFSDTIDNNFEPAINANFEFLSEDEILENQLNTYSDFTVKGMVALSQGRFMHFGHSLNLIRHYQNESGEIKSMVFSLTERKQLKPDELHYFDNPWFGSIVNITEYLGEEQNEE